MKNLKILGSLIILSLLAISLYQLMVCKRTQLNSVRQLVERNDSIDREVQKRILIIEKLEKQNDSIQLKLDSLDKVKQKIIIKYEKATPIILDASATDDVIWLDTKLEDLRNE